MSADNSCLSVKNVRLKKCYLICNTIVSQVVSLVKCFLKISVYILIALCYNAFMAVSSDNKRYFVTISKKDYARLKEVADKEHRSVSAQSLHFILEGINKLEGKRD